MNGYRASLNVRGDLVGTGKRASGHDNIFRSCHVNICKGNFMTGFRSGNTSECCGCPSAL